MIADAFLWWLTAQFLGLLALPIAFRVFKSLPDRGYNFSKALAILLLSFFLWIGGLSHVLPNSATSISVILLVMAFVSAYLAMRAGPEMLDFLRREKWTILTSELLFAAIFSFWALVKVYDPGINHTEKPMDFALLNGILNSRFLPPNDPWLSGNSISYYYFGYFQSAALTKLTGLSPNVTYNLSLVLIASLAFQGAFGLVYNLVRLFKPSANGTTGPGIGAGIAFGLLAAIFVVLLGNLEGVLEFAQANGWGAKGVYEWVAVRGLEGTQSITSWYPTDTWWWWKATRLLSVPVDGQFQETISEFPFFSFMLGDLHPHVMALPFVLMALGLSLNVLTSRESFTLRWALRNPLVVLVLVIAIGSLGFLNSWDLPAYAMIFLLALAIQSYFRLDKRLLPTLRSALPLLVLLGLGFILLYLPFYLSLQTQVQGILPVEQVTTRPQHFFLFWGPLFLISLVTIGALAWQLVRTERGNLWSRRYEMLAYFGVALIPYALWFPSRLGVGLYQGDDLGGIPLEAGSKFGRLVPAHLAMGLALFTFVRSVRQEGEPRLPLVFVSLLVAVAYLLILVPEFFFINDFFHTRMNTIFKFYYQGWVLLATSSAFGLYYLHSQQVPKRTWSKVGPYTFWSITGLLVLGSLLYPMAATYSKTNNFSGEPTFDGLEFIRQRDPGEYQAIEWLRENVDHPAVIVEAVGNDYNPDFARISGSTGLPTLIGWVGHEHQWRGTLEPFGDRPRVVSEIYNSTEVEAVKELLERFQVTHVFVGRVERQKYRAEGLKKFDQFADKVYDQGGVQIYKLRGS